MLDAHACILNGSHRLREIHKADRLNFKIVPNRHQATDFYQIKIELYKQIRYGTNMTGFKGVFQVIDHSARAAIPSSGWIATRLVSMLASARSL